MSGLARKIWTDPVISKVIATAICAAAAVGARYVFGVSIPILVMAGTAVLWVVLLYVFLRKAQSPIVESGIAGRSHKRPAYSPTTRRIALLGIFLLPFLSVGASVWEHYSRSFPKKSFAVAIAALRTRDFTATTVDHAEALVQHGDVESLLGTTYLKGEELRVRAFDEVFYNHEEAREWGRGKGAAVVIWGAAERGTSTVVVHLKATRIALPELSNTKETYRRFFLHIMFSDLFDSDGTYATEFNLGDLTVDRANPRGLEAVQRKAALLACLVRGVLFYTQGEYSQAIRRLEEVKQAEFPDLGEMARRWLVLCYLNDRDYAAALRTFSDRTEGQPVQGEDLVRLGFLQQCYTHFVKGVVPFSSESWAKPLRQALSSGQISPTLRGVSAGLLAAGRSGLVQRSWPDDHWLQESNKELANLQSVLENATRESPNDFFLQYLLAMIAATPSTVDEALHRAEQLNPNAAEVHFALSFLSRQVGADYLGALHEIDKALALNPSQIEYWQEKWGLLEELKNRHAVGAVRDDLRHQQIELAERFLRLSNAPQETRAQIFKALTLDYYAEGQNAQALDTLNRMTRKLPDRADLCAFAAAMSVRNLGMLGDATRFLECAARSSSVSDPAVEELAAQLAWRQGHFNDAAGDYINIVFGKRWKRRPDESVALLITLANIASTAGKYQEAQGLLREAEARLAQIRIDGSEIRGIDGATGDDADLVWNLPENNWKWMWAATFDRGLISLVQQNYADSLHDFKEAVRVMTTYNFARRIRHLPGLVVRESFGMTGPTTVTYESGRESGISPIEDSYPDMALLTRLCQGYADFKAHHYEAAADAWWQASHHVRLTGYREENLQDEFAELKRHEQHFSPQVSEIADRLFEELVQFKKYSEAQEFIETNALTSMEDSGKQWTSRLLFVLLKENNYARVESVFLDFARKYGFGSSFKNPITGLNTSLYSGWFKTQGPYWITDYFLVAVSTDPYPPRRTK